MKKALSFIFTLILLCSVLCSCKGNTDAPAKDADGISAIELCGNDTVSCPGTSFNENELVIEQGGKYSVSGELADGHITVNAAVGSVTLVLDNASITCSDGPALLVLNSDEFYLELADGSENSLCCGEACDITEKYNSVFFSKENVVIGGSGKLTVDAPSLNGIASKDILTVNGGDITVHSVNHGIKGKDALIINGGSINVTAGKDGIKASNDKDENLGYLEINGGVISIEAQDDGLYAVTKLTVNGGDIRIDSANNGIKCEGNVYCNGGSVDISTLDDGFVCAERIISESASVTVNGVQKK